MTANAISDHPHLNQAPIVEAIVDFRVFPREGLTGESLEPLYALVSNQYPTKHVARQMHGQLQVREGAAAGSTFTHMDVGFRAESADKLHVLQANIAGFTLSRLRPYDRWETLRDEARRIWDIYRSIAQPNSITRVAVRYINRIEFKPPFDFDDYLTQSPGIPDSLPQVVNGFLTRVVVPYENSGIQIVITQALEAPFPSTGVIPVILDVDVFLEAAFAVDSDDPWRTLDQMRHLKNRAFFGSLTEKALEMLK